MEHCHQKSPFTPFRVFFHSKTYCPTFNSHKEWKSTLLHLESNYFRKTKIRVFFCRHFETEYFLNVFSFFFFLFLFFSFLFFSFLFFSFLFSFLFFFFFLLFFFPLFWVIFDCLRCVQIWCKFCTKILTEKYLEMLG